MNKLTIFLLCLGVSGCAHKTELAPAELLAEGQRSIVIKVDNIVCCEGVLRLAVYNDEAYWMKDANMVRGRLGFIQSETQTFEVHGLPEGRYAVAVYQDVDSDSKLDRWFGLLPKEPYGFSNNVGKYGPASFDKASFDLIEDKTITIRLNSR